MRSYGLLVQNSIVNELAFFLLTMCTWLTHDTYCITGQLVGFDQLDYAITEGDQQRAVTVLKEGENVGPLTLRITPLTFDQFFSEGNVLPDALQSQDLRDPAECK